MYFETPTETWLYRKQNCELKYYLSLSSVLSNLSMSQILLTELFFSHFTMKSMSYELVPVILTSTLLPLYYLALWILNGNLLVGNFGRK